ncbi:ead/Ea22-like family protein [Lelliottia wanjuensis]|uniref:ead/Ea22-like family protein n=1 Tax=Lelliottia wanjuensis TaxID=3050585 RepID=UPI00254D84F5|nr:ead/Ea22-like family protein [Lelliottia sp. V104_15]MDK9607084.1 ead/Ea22-like family protein [Lelliottia sp. V104_15]
MSTNKQALREAAERATHERWAHLNGIVYAHTEETEWELFEGKAYRNEDAAFIAAANPATVLALLDELEALDRRNAELNSTLERWATDRAQSASELDDAEKRIAELEARSVKLPEGYATRLGHPINESERSVMIPKEGGAWLSRFDVEHALRVAGIPVKGN